MQSVASLLLRENGFHAELCVKRQKKKKNLLHGFEESLAVVLEGHDELQLSASRLHRCWNKKKKQQL